MRQFFDENDIPSPKCFKAHSLVEAIDVVGKEFEGQEFFIKPPNVGGSSYTKKLSNIHELKEIWETFFLGSWKFAQKFPTFCEMKIESPDQYFMLIEEVLGGTCFEYDEVLGPLYPTFELSVEGFIQGETTNVFSITDKLLPDSSLVHGEELMLRMHSRLPQSLKRVLVERVGKINRCLGARVGCSHTEFRVEEVGPDEADAEYGGRYYRARVIETALRIGGGPIQSTIYSTTGFNSIRAMAYQACGIEHDEQVLFRTPTMVAAVMPDKSGILQGVQGIDYLMGLDQRVPRFFLYETLGTPVIGPPEAVRGVAEFVVCDSDENLLEIDNWETRTGESSPYKSTEILFLDLLKKLSLEIV
jgi:hypothetical protein